MTTHIAEVIVRLPTDVLLEFDARILVSLDCDYCRRARRTVAFTVGEEAGQCFPGSATRPGKMHPPYPGRIVEIVVRREEEELVATYHLEYATTAFVDAAYGPDQRPWSGRPQWARVGATLTCPNCGHKQPAGFQNNVNRPIEKRCRCGAALYAWQRELPLLRWLDSETGEWHTAPERYGTDRKTPLTLQEFWLW